MARNIERRKVAPAEQEPSRPRFVIFGSRISGAYGARNAFEKHLAEQGYEDANVVAEREAALIKATFYNISPEDAYLRELGPPKPRRALRKLGSTLLRRELALPKNNPIDVPNGVVVFPHMRLYTPEGSGMFIPSPREYIQELCDQNGVPVIFMEDVRSEAELASAVSSLQTQPPALKQAD